MPQRKDTEPTRVTPTLRTSAGDSGKPGQATSGRVAHDDRGNAVWELRTGDHQFLRDGSTTLVRKLVPPLSLEATVIVKTPPEMPVPQRAVPLGAGADRVPLGTVRTFPVRSSSAALKRPAAQAKTATPARPGLFGRLFTRKP